MTSRLEGLSAGVVGERGADLGSEFGDPSDDRFRGTDQGEHDRAARFGLELADAAVLARRKRVEQPLGGA